MIKQSLFILAVSAAFAPLALADTQRFDIEAFSAIDTRGAINVIYTAGADTSLTAEEKDGDFSDLYLENDGDTLVISRKSLRDRRGWFKNISMKRTNDGKTIKVNGKRVPTYTVRVTGPALQSARVVRSSDLHASGIDADSFDARVSSSGDAILAGRAGTVTLDASSSGDLDARELLATNLTVDASSSADIWGYAANGDVTIDASSSSDVSVVATRAPKVAVEASSSADVELSGTCGTIEASASSSGDIEADELLCTDANLRGSSGADISAYATASLFARASSGADISVDGAPEANDVKESSGGDISF